ncbi:MAG: hypothetical protein ABI882_14485 [Acidobacteriota bacterium]
MSLIDIYSGRANWADYLKAHEALESGGDDFDIVGGDALWRSELTQETINDLLEEVRLPEFEREARAFRTRAERAYLNGWYEEALTDFLEAAKRNYPDYSVHRSIACLYLYHIIDLPGSLEYFRKAAKYSRPSNTRQCAEAHYFAGIVCALEQRLDEALSHLTEAVSLHPSLSEAQYQLASLSAFVGEHATALACLEEAIKGEARYFDRSRRDGAFDGMRREVDALLDELLQPIRERVADVRRNAQALDGYVIAPVVEERIANILRDVDECMNTEINYQTGIGVMDKLAAAERELGTIHQRFHRQYQMDARDYIRCLVFSPDGQYLVTGLLNGGLQIWEVNSGMLLSSIRGHLASVSSLSFSPDNLWFASSGRDRRITIWEAQTGLEVQTLTGHSSEVRSVAFSPDGQWLVSGGHDRTIRTWRAATGSEVQTLIGHHGPVTSTIFSPSGRRIASGSWDRTIRVWDVATGREVTSFEAHARGVAALAASPDGSLIASGGEDGEIKLWNLSSGRESAILTSGHRNSVTSLAFSPDGALLAAGSLGRSTTIFRVASGAVVKRARNERISYNSVAFSPQGQWLAFGSRNVQLWLKDLLTESEYGAVREGEARAREARLRAERLASYQSLKRVV